MLFRSEKYKNEFIELLATASGACDKIYGLRTNKKTCPPRSGPEGCKKCERLNKQWLEAEAPVFDFEELEAGDKIKMKKRGSTEF